MKVGQMDKSEDVLPPAERGAGGGFIFVVGIGPGTPGLLTGDAVAAVAQADVVIGYRTYIEQLRPMFPDKDYRAGSMGKETERCREALELAAAGNVVAVVSSGDAGIYGMAGPMLELAGEVPVHVVPGVTAAQTAAAILGSPLTNDFITISLSDLLTPRDEVLRRAGLAAASDLVVCIYNPSSVKRGPLFEAAWQLFLQHRPPETPVGWVRDAGGDEQEARILRLANVLGQKTDMRTIIIVGNSQTDVIGGRMVTRRGYENKGRGD